MDTTKTIPLIVAALMLTVALPGVAAEPDPGVERCGAHMEGPRGQPYVLPYPCLEEEENGDEPTPEVEWCEEHTEDPLGQPTIVRYPCKVYLESSTTNDFPPEIRWCEGEEIHPSFTYQHPCFDVTQGDEDSDGEDGPGMKMCVATGDVPGTPFYYVFAYPCEVHTSL